MEITNNVARPAPGVVDAAVKGGGQCPAVDGEMGGNGFGNNGFGNNGFGNNGAGTVPGDHSDLSVGCLLKDTYSFLYVYSACPPSAPFFYALTLFSFQALVYGLLLTSLVDVRNPSNPLGVPPSVSMEMRIAQGCAILIAVFNSVDIMVAMNNLLRAPGECVRKRSVWLDFDQICQITGMCGVGDTSNTNGGVVCCHFRCRRSTTATDLAA